MEVDSVGRITIEERDDAGKPIVLRWKNRAGVSWRLFPDPDAGGLRTDAENPYYASNPAHSRFFHLEFDKDAKRRPRASGFWFQNQLYVKTDAAPLSQGVRQESGQDE